MKPPAAPKAERQGVCGYSLRVFAIESERHRHRGFAYSFNICCGAEEGQIDAKSLRDVQSHASCGLPKVAQISSAATELQSAQSVLRAGLEFGFLQAAHVVRVNGPSIHCIRAADGVSNRQLDRPRTSDCPFLGLNKTVRGVLCGGRKPGIRDAIGALEQAS